MKNKFLSTFGRSTVEDPLKSFNWVIEISGIARAGAKKVTMPEGTVDVIEYREGGDNAIVQKSPGLVRYSDIVIERGVILAAGQGDMDFYNWWKQVIDIAAQNVAASEVIRKDFDIVELSRGGNRSRRWRVREAWPSKFKPGSDKDGTSSDNNYESITIVHEGFVPV